MEGTAPIFFMGALFAVIIAALITFANIKGEESVKRRVKEALVIEIEGTEYRCLQIPTGWKPDNDK